VLSAQEEMYEQAAGRQRTGAVPQTALQVPRVPERPFWIDAVGFGIGLMMVVAVSSNSSAISGWVMATESELLMMRFSLTPAHRAIAIRRNRPGPRSRPSSHVCGGQSCALMSLPASTLRTWGDCSTGLRQAVRRRSLIS
jgi:hypothetical protein